jgi:methionyl-tRNA formyltransferase
MSKTIIFFGSGTVAQQSLKFLKQHLKIELVITKSSLKTSLNPVIEEAQKNNIPLKFANNKDDLTKLFNNSFQSELAILIDYGVIIPQNIIDSFKFSIVNSHFSILPDLRGADPITYALLSGQKSTGVSLMKLVSALDEGPLLDWQKITINSQTNNETLTDQLIELSNQLIKKNIIDRDWTTWKWQDQSSTHQKVSYSKKIFKEDGKLNFNLPAEQLERQIRAFHSWPKSYCNLQQQLIIINQARVLDLEGQPGHFFIHNHQLAVYCQQKALLIDSIQPANKKTMSSRDFLNGYRHLIA